MMLTLFKHHSWILCEVFLASLTCKVLKDVLYAWKKCFFKQRLWEFK